MSESHTHTAFRSPRNCRGSHRVNRHESLPVPVPVTWRNVPSVLGSATRVDERIAENSLGEFQ